MVEHSFYYAYWLWARDIIVMQDGGVQKPNELMCLERVRLSSRVQESYHSKKIAKNRDRG